jgi:hypothetical protein
MARKVWLIMAAGLLSSVLWEPTYCGAQGLESASAGKSQATSHEDTALPQTVKAVEAELAALKAQVQTLESKLEELRGKMVPVEPAEEIKRVTEWVCERGHVFSIAPEGGRCPYDQTPVVSREQYHKVKLARRQTLSEIVEARLEEQSRQRVAVAASATGIIQQTVGAGPNRLRGEGSLDVLLIARPAFNTLFFADVEAIGGNGPDPFTGSVSGLNADAGSLQDSDRVDRVSLREAWVMTQLFEGRLTGVVGKLDLTNYFDRNAVANDETSQFVSGMFVNNPLLGQPVEGVGHQANAPGPHLAWDTFRQWRFGIGLQLPENSGSALGRTPFTIGEIGYSTQLLGGLGNYRLWGRHNGGEQGSRAVGINFDQWAGHWLRAFGRYGWQTGGSERDRQAWSLGLGIRSFLLSRPRDETGLAYGWMRAANGRAEDLAELYHRFYLTEHLAVSLIAQYVFHLAGNDQVRPRAGVLVGGVRTQVNF